METIRDFLDRATNGNIREEVLAYLGQVPLFEELTAEQLRYLADQMQARVYDRGERIFSKGSAGHELHVVLEGTVALRDRDASDREVVVAVRGRGESFGEIGFMTSEPRTLSAVNGSEPGLHLVLTRFDFERIAALTPDLALVVFEHMVSLMSDRMKTLPAAQRNYLMWGYAPPRAEGATRGAATVVGLLVSFAAAGVLSIWPHATAAATLAHVAIAALLGLLAAAVSAGRVHAVEQPGAER